MILLFFYLLGFWLCENPNVKTVSYVQVQGSCWDSSNGVDLIVSVSATSEGRTTKLADSDELGIFRLQIPINISELLFESKGYESITVPVHFIGDFDKKSKFNIGLKMNVKGAKSSFIDNYAIFCVPDNNDKNFKYEFVRAKDNFFITDLSIQIHANRSANFGLTTHHPLGEYSLLVKGKQGNVLTELDFLLKNGLNIIDTNTKLKVEVGDTTNKLLNVVFSPQTLYFSQSSHDLQPEAKAILDSAASYLLSHREAKILVVGYTDNVGSREPNIILSEYRARVSAGYLQKQRVNPTQIVIKWEGPNQQTVTLGTANVAAKNRRVTLEIIK